MVNIELKNHRNSDIPWIARYQTFDRVPSYYLEDLTPLVQNFGDFDNKQNSLSKTEMVKLRKDYIVLLARVLVGFVDFMKILANDVPSHIHHKNMNMCTYINELIN